MNLANIVMHVLGEQDSLKVVMSKNVFLRNLLKLRVHARLTDAYACAKFLRDDTC